MRQIYQSTSPKVWDHIVSRRAESKVWGERVNAFIVENLPEGTSGLLRHGFGGRCFGGFSLPDGARVPGLAKSSRTGTHFPTRSAAGLRIEAAIDAIGEYPERFTGMPGMPGGFFTGCAFWTPSVAAVDETQSVWIAWGTDISKFPDADAWEGYGVDNSMWRLVPLSEYHTLVEAGKDPLK